MRPSASPRFSTAAYAIVTQLVRSASPEPALAGAPPPLVRQRVRPLADVLRRTAPGAGSDPAPSNPSPSGPNPSPSGPSPSPSNPTGRIRPIGPRDPRDPGGLCRHGGHVRRRAPLAGGVSVATKLCVRLHGTGGALPELAEAVAALQDVACAAAPAGVRPSCRTSRPACLPASQRRAGRPLPGHQRADHPDPPRPAAAHAAPGGPLPVRRLGAQAVLRRLARGGVHRRQGPEQGLGPARRLPRRAGHDLRQPRHLPSATRACAPTG